MSHSILSTSPRERIQIAGDRIDLVTSAGLISTLEDAVEERRKSKVVFCTVNTLVGCHQLDSLRSAVDQAEVVSPDGMPLVWLAKMKGKSPVERVDGPTFMPRAMAHGVKLGWRHYLYGGTERVLDSLASSLKRNHPGVDIVGGYAPPFRPLSPEEETEVIEDINRTAPDFVWVGLGTPKQEIWMADYHERLDAPVLLGVGAAFDFHAGVRKRAPLWMQRHGLEWMHRLSQEPRRLGGRYLKGNLQFLYYVLQDFALARLSHLRGAR